jgi:hypothetical protein
VLSAPPPPHRRCLAVALQRCQGVHHGGESAFVSQGTSVQASRQFPAHWRDRHPGHRQYPCVLRRQVAGRKPHYRAIRFGRPGKTSCLHVSILAP